MNAKIRAQLAQRKRRIQRRLDPSQRGSGAQPILTASHLAYDLAERGRGIAHGGLGALHALAQGLGLPEAIDQRLHLLQIHLPYHESDHVLNFAYNALCEGTCLQDMDLRRQDEVFLDALGARRLPDPTTAGDFCRRFRAADLATLRDIFNDIRRQVWAQQPPAFFAQATLDMDGSLVATTGQCKHGMDIAYDGTWGYHPLILSLAQTGEVLSLVNRSGNRPSHEGAAAEVDVAVELCLSAGFGRVLLRGDTAFSQTEHLDRWNQNPRVRFIFGYDAMANVQALAEQLPAHAWKKLERPPRYTVQTQPRQRPDHVKDRIVRQRQFESLRLQSEEVAEFNYRPLACQETYRLIVVRKNISREKGELRLFDEVRYFFYLTNEWVLEAHEIVGEANDRCDQENLLAQLAGGVRALKAPLDNLLSNAAYMLMTALAWNLKAWWALSLPERPGRWQERHRADKRWVLGLEFRTFVQAFVRLPCQIVRTGRRLLYRLLSWNPYQGIFFRLVDVLRC